MFSTKHYNIYIFGLTHFADVSLIRNLFIIPGKDNMMFKVYLHKVHKSSNWHIEVYVHHILDPHKTMNHIILKQWSLKFYCSQRKVETLLITWQLLLVQGRSHMSIYRETKWTSQPGSMHCPSKVWKEFAPAQKGRENVLCLFLIFFEYLISLKINLKLFLFPSSVSKLCVSVESEKAVGWEKWWIIPVVV